MRVIRNRKDKTIERERGGSTRGERRARTHLHQIKHAPHARSHRLLHLENHLLLFYGRHGAQERRGPEMGVGARGGGGHGLPPPRPPLLLLLLGACWERKQALVALSGDKGLVLLLQDVRGPGSRRKVARWCGHSARGNEESP